MRLLRTALAAFACLSMTFGAVAQSTAPAPLAKSTTKPAEIIIVGGKPAASARASSGRASTQTVSAGAGSQGMDVNNNITAMNLKSVGSKQSSNTAVIESVMGASSGAKQKILRDGSH